MHPFAAVDWLMVAIPLVIVLVVGWKTQKHLKAVSDFTSGGRVAGRFLLSVASGESSMGLISVVGLWEMYYNSGFAVGFWGGLAVLAGLLMGLTGYCAYRFRETRCLTMAQFLEVRYSRGVRLYSGWLSVISGIVNYAIFPAVGARFIMHYAGLPSRTELFGLGFSTYGLLLTAALVIAFAMIWFGGQLTIMCTDCVQGILGFWMYGVLLVAVLMLMSWDQIAFALISVPEPGQSLVNPFDILDKSDFNFYYIAIGVFGGILNRMSWQGSQGYFSAAKNAHEAKMAGILGSWRGMFIGMMLLLLAIVGFTYLNHPDFTPYADSVRSTLHLTVDNPAVRHQLLVPMALSDLLPIGITGLMLASMILLMISTDNTYIHSWGTILFQDCLMPHMKTKLGPRSHLMGLRMAALFVAVFAWMFSYYFGQTDYILMFFALTGTIYLGGAGPCIVGGLYWKRGTPAAAYTSFTVGGLLGTFGMVLSQPSLWQPMALFLRNRLDWKFLAPYMDRFPVNGQWLYFIAMATALLLYILVSIFTCRAPFNLDRMLHRGGYALAGEGPKAGWRFSLRSLLGITDDFSRHDKALAWSVFLWGTLSWLVMLFAIAYNLFVGNWADESWARYFFITSLCVPAILGVGTAVWFTVGGIRDLRSLFASLPCLQRDECDDGHVAAPGEEVPPGAWGEFHKEDNFPTAAHPLCRPGAVPVAPRKLSGKFVSAALLMLTSLFLPWLALPDPVIPLGDNAFPAGNGQSETYTFDANEALAETVLDGLSRSPALAAMPESNGTGMALSDSQSPASHGKNENKRARYWGIELPWESELPGRIDRYAAVLRWENAFAQLKDASRQRDAFVEEREERKTRFAHLESLLRGASPKAADNALALAPTELPAFVELPDATEILREQWRWEAGSPPSVLEKALSLEELAPILRERTEGQKTRYAQAMRHAGGRPPRDFNVEALDALDGHGNAMLAILWRNERVRLDHAERKMERIGVECGHLRAKARNVHAEMRLVFASPPRVADHAAFLLYAGPLFALIALALGLAGRIVAAYRVGLVAGLGSGSVMLIVMLLFPETLGSCLSIGFLSAVFSSFLMVALSALALVEKSKEA